MLNRVHAKKCQVRRTAARFDPDPDGNAQARHALRGQPIHVRRRGTFEFGPAMVRGRQASQTIHDEQHDAAARLGQGGIETACIHGFGFLD